MLSFDAKKRISQIDGKLTRGTLPKRVANREKRAARAIEKLIEWCEQRGIKVGFDADDEGGYAYMIRMIEVKRYTSTIRQQCILMHEMGHAQLSLTKSKVVKQRIRDGYTQRFNSSLKNTFTHRLAILEEEMLAWHLGYELAQSLGCAPPRKMFNAVKTNCIKTYLRWALDPKDDCAY
jgi:hypothetical protein